jgi:hypothetical protein
MIVLYSIISGLAFVIISFFAFFGIAKMDKDITSGGAYFALFFISIPVTFVLGIISYLLFSHLSS